MGGLVWKINVNHSQLSLSGTGLSAAKRGISYLLDARFISVTETRAINPKRSITRASVQPAARTQRSPVNSTGKPTHSRNSRNVQLPVA